MADSEQMIVRKLVSWTTPSVVSGAGTISNSAQIDFGNWLVDQGANKISQVDIVYVESGTAGKVLAWFTLAGGSELQPVTGQPVRITMTSTNTTFGVIALAYINAAIQSDSNFEAIISVLPIIEIVVHFEARSLIGCAVQLVIPEYLILRGHVSIDGVPVVGAFVRVISDDGLNVFTSNTDIFGNYEVPVNSSGVYHVLSYKKDVGGNIFSSVSQPYIEVTPLS